MGDPAVRLGYICKLRRCKCDGLEIISTETARVSVPGGASGALGRAVQCARLQTRAGAVKGAYLAMTLAMTNQLLASCRLAGVMSCSISDPNRPHRRERPCPEANSTMMNWFKSRKPGRTWDCLWRFATPNCRTYTIAGIWASLKLGTSTPRDAVARKLERNQWLLDIVVDTEIDRGDFTQSETAYRAIFAAIKATSRCRGLVVQTFPAQTNFPEHLVTRALQGCSNATMSRLRSFKIKCARPSSSVCCASLAPRLGRSLPRWKRIQRMSHHSVSLHIHNPLSTAFRTVEARAPHSSDGRVQHICYKVN